MEDYSRRMITGDEYNLHPNAMLVPHELLPDHEVVPLRETPEASFPQSFGFSEPRENGRRSMKPPLTVPQDHTEELPQASTHRSATGVAHESTHRRAPTRLGAEGGKDRRVLYTDGDQEDLSVQDLVNLSLSDMCSGLG